jgi:energy-coupling factor transport system permease protein
MNLLLPGLYIPTNSPLHRLDPRVKMGAALLLMTIPFAAPSLRSNLLLSAFVIALALLSSAPPLALLRTLRTILWVGFFMFFFYLFTTPGRPLVALGSAAVTWEGLLAGATQIYRLCLLVVIAALLTFTTSPSQLAHGLEALLGPLTRLGLPVRELAMVVTIALRFVPTFFDEIDKITKAQQARGVDVHSRNPLQRVRSWVPPGRGAGHGNGGTRLPGDRAPHAAVPVAPDAPGFAGIADRVGRQPGGRGAGSTDVEDQEV